MGVCQSDPLTQLIQNYGQDVCKYIVTQKSIQFLDDTTPKFKDRLQQQVKNTAANFDQQFDERDKQIKQNFSTTVEDIKRSNPGTLQSAAKVNNKTQQQMLGFNSIQAQLTKLKGAKDEKIKQQQGYLLKLIDQNKQKLQKELVDGKPSLPLYEKMSIYTKQKVMADGQEKFGSVIKSEQQKITNTFEQAVDINNFQATLKKFVGLQQADRLSKDSASTFSKAKRALTFTTNPKSCFGR